MKKIRFTNGIQGKGFAAALVLSICAVGLSTYAAYNGAVRNVSTGTKQEKYDDNVFIFTEPAETVNAEKLGIPVQASVREGGGNNGAKICLSDKGTPVIVVAIPVRYIHSHNCVATYHDFNAAVDLAVAILKDLDPEKIMGF